MIVVLVTLGCGSEAPIAVHVSVPEVGSARSVPLSHFGGSSEIPADCIAATASPNVIEATNAGTRLAGGALEKWAYPWRVGEATKGALRARIGARKAAIDAGCKGLASDAPLLIVADRGAPYQQVAGVVEDAMLAGFSDIALMVSAPATAPAVAEHRVGTRTTIRVSDAAFTRIDGPGAPEAIADLDAWSASQTAHDVVLQGDMNVPFSRFASAWSQVGKRGLVILAAGTAESTDSKANSAEVLGEAPLPDPVLVLSMRVMKADELDLASLFDSARGKPSPFEGLNGTLPGADMTFREQSDWPTDRPPAVPGPKTRVATDDPPAVPPEIALAVRKRVGQLKYCYESGLKRRQDLAGRVEVTWRIAAGKAEDVEVYTDTTGDAELGQCIVRKISSWPFDPAISTKVTWPFIFSAEKP